MEQPLEQQRARDAWERSEGCSDDYMKLAKGLPALIMNSGLLQTLAFLRQKDPKEECHHGQLACHLRKWLSARFKLEPSFDGIMNQLLDEKPARFQEITTEAHAWLRWMRQIAAARCAKAE